MKSIKILLSCLISILFLSSCKKENQSEKEIIDVKKEDTFKVTLNLLIKSNDTLHLYFTEDNSVNFIEEGSIWISVPGKEEAQDVVFELPESVFPTQFRIDFGVNTKNEEIIFNRFSLNYKNNTFTASDSNIFNYFRPDENVTILDTSKRSLKRKNPSERRGASLYPHQTILGQEIQKLAKQ